MLRIIGTDDNYEVILKYVDTTIYKGVFTEQELINFLATKISQMLNDCTAYQKKQILDKLTGETR